MTKPWLEGFAAVDPDILKPALDLVTKRARRMPWPGDLTEAIAIVQERRGFGESEHCKPTEVPSKDPETGRPVTAWVYQDDPKPELHYRAVDCPEGRAFIATMRKLAKKKPQELTARPPSPLPSPAPEKSLSELPNATAAHSRSRP